MPAQIKVQTTPEEANPAQESLRNFLAFVSAARLSLLLLDFDGTLAPFRNDPAQVRPWAGVPQLLDDIQASAKTRLVLISGRPARDVAAHLGLRAPVEVWGLHGAERLLPDGHIAYEKLPLQQQILLNAARTALHDSRVAEPNLAANSCIRLENKWNAVAAHWRGASAHAAAAASQSVHAIVEPFAKSGELELLHFDGGIELRAGSNKGHAVKRLLHENTPGTPAAYLGDDTTDEYAFEAIAGHGLGILVRRAWRPTAASLWIRPPHGLRAFLRSWLSAVQS